MGRKRNGQAEAEWRKRLAKFRRSGLTVAEFCRREGISQPSFYHWRRRLEDGKGIAKSRRANRPAGPATVEFLPLHMTSAAAVAEVEFPNGVRVRVPAESIEALRAAVLAGSQLCREGKGC